MPCLGDWRCIPGKEEDGSAAAVALLYSEALGVAVLLWEQGRGGIMYRVAGKVYSVATDGRRDEQQWYVDGLYAARASIACGLRPNCALLRGRWKLVHDSAAGRISGVHDEQGEILVLTADCVWHTRAGVLVGGPGGSGVVLAVAQMLDNVKVRKFNTAGAVHAVVSFNDHRVREAILKQGTEVSVGGIKVRLAREVVKASGDEVPTGIFATWAVKAEKATPLPEHELAKYFEARCTEVTKSLRAEEDDERGDAKRAGRVDGSTADLVRQPAEEVPGKVKVKKFPSPGAWHALISFPDHRLREAILSQGTQVSVRGVQVALQSQVDKAKGEEVLTGIFATWAAEAEKATPLPKGELAKFFEVRCAEVTEAWQAEEQRRRDGEEDEARGDANCVGGVDRSADPLEEEECENVTVRKHSNAGCAVVFFPDNRVREAILSLGEEVLISGVQVKLHRHKDKVTGEDPTGIWASWGAKVEKATPLPEADLAKYFEARYEKVLEAWLVEAEQEQRRQRLDILNKEVARQKEEVARQREELARRKEEEEQRRRRAEELARLREEEEQKCRKAEELARLKEEEEQKRREVEELVRLREEEEQKRRKAEELARLREEEQRRRRAEEEIARLTEELARHREEVARLQQKQDEEEQKLRNANEPARRREQEELRRRREVELDRQGEDGFRRQPEEPAGAVKVPRRLAPTAENDISTIPTTPWEKVELKRSFLEELRANQHIKKRVPRVETVAHDVERKVRALRADHDPQMQALCAKFADDSELAAVVAYTHDCLISTEVNFFSELNGALRTRGHGRKALVDVWGIVVRYMLQGLVHLNEFRGTVYRGVPHKATVLTKYTKTTPVQWGAFTSTSVSFDAAKQFMGDLSDGVIFKIDCAVGHELHSVSFFPTEGEILLSPSSEFAVISDPYERDGFTCIDLMMMNAKDRLVS